MLCPGGVARLNGITSKNFNSQEICPPSAQALRGADVVHGAGRRTLMVAGAPAPHCEGAADDSLS